MKNRWVEILGMVSAALTTVSFVPQAISIWKNRPAPAMAVSLPMYVILNLGIVGWFVYGIEIGARPVWIANAITFAFAFSILVYKKIYG